MDGPATRRMRRATRCARLPPSPAGDAAAIPAGPRAHAGDLQRAHSPGSAVAHWWLRGALYRIVRGPGLLREGVPRARLLRDERRVRPLSPARRQPLRRRAARGAVLARRADGRADRSVPLVRALLRARPRHGSRALAHAALAAHGDLAASPPRLAP